MSNITTYIEAGRPSNIAGQTYKYIWQLMAEYKFATFVILWLAIIWACEISINAYLLKTIINQIALAPQQQIIDYILLPIILYLIVFCVVQLSFRMYTYFVDIKMIPALREKIITQSLEKLFVKNHAYYQNNMAGNIVNKINDLANGVPEIIKMAGERFARHFFALIIAIITLYQVHFMFACFMSAWAVVFSYSTYRFMHKATVDADAWSQHNSIAIGKLTDIVAHVSAIKLHNTKTYELNRFKASYQDCVTAEVKIQKVYFWVWNWYGYTIFILLTLNFFFLAKGLQSGWLTLGDFAQVLMLNVLIINIFWQLATYISQFSKSLGRVKHALDMLDDPLHNETQKIANQHAFQSGQIEFQNVAFGYNVAETILNIEALTINPGEKIGIVGYSGGGKTTFVNLLLRLYDVAHGKIFIDGTDITHASYDSVRNMISVIPQDPSIFHRSIMENIRYGNDSATTQEVIQAATIAQAHVFIADLPDGYQTIVGERGVKLSGGQRQRIAIARAILKKSPILILDEATSQLDSITELSINSGLLNLMRQKTIIIIAHRISTLAHMDRILVFEHGRIVQSGTHQELIDRPGLYRKLWQTQSLSPLLT